VGGDHRRRPRAAARGDGTVGEPRHYQLLRQPDPIRERLFEIAFLDAGVGAYAFTFG
jgi:hypothetical protein